jgi:hypothetical protein
MYYARMLDTEPNDSPSPRNSLLLTFNGAVHATAGDRDTEPIETKPIIQEDIYAPTLCG